MDRIYYELYKYLYEYELDFDEYLYDHHEDFVIFIEYINFNYHIDDDINLSDVVEDFKNHLLENENYLGKTNGVLGDIIFNGCLNDLNYFSGPCENPYIHRCIDLIYDSNTEILNAHGIFNEDLENHKIIGEYCFILNYDNNYDSIIDYYCHSTDDMFDDEIRDMLYKYYKNHLIK